jgi:hypothetical protein
LERLHADQKWKFSELPPSQFEKRLELNRSGVDLSEFERAKCFWRRRPRLILGEGLPGYLLVVFIGVLLLFIPKIGVPLVFWVPFPLLRCHRSGYGPARAMETSLRDKHKSTLAECLTL